VPNNVLKQYPEMSRDKGECIVFFIKQMKRVQTWINQFFRHTQPLNQSHKQTMIIRVDQGACATHPIAHTYQHTYQT
jgi:hypothetical protein